MSGQSASRGRSVPVVQWPIRKQQLIIHTKCSSHGHLHNSFSTARPHYQLLFFRVSRKVWINRKLAIISDSDARIEEKYNSLKLSDPIKLSFIHLFGFLSIKQHV